MHQTARAGTTSELKLNSKKLKGLWVALQQEGSKMWTFQRTELSQPSSFIKGSVK
jgi:hypothetical protein